MKLIMDISKYTIFIMLFSLLANAGFTQEKVDKILLTDSINFTISSYGQWGGHTTRILILKQPSGNYIVSYTDQNGKKNSSSITNNELRKFGKTFKSNMQGEKECGCTLSTNLSLQSNVEEISYTTTCCGKKLPEKLYKTKLNLIK